MGSIAPLKRRFVTSIFPQVMGEGACCLPGTQPVLGGSGPGGATAKPGSPRQHQQDQVKGWDVACRIEAALEVVGRWCQPFLQSMVGRTVHQGPRGTCMELAGAPRKVVGKG